MRPIERPAHSWRDQPEIPGFDHDRLLVVLDGACGLCSATARRIAHFDRADRVRLCTVQSVLGQGLMRHYGLSPDDPESFLLIEDGRAYGSLDAAIRLFSQLNPVFLPLVALRLLPRSVQDWLYARVARNRYRLFGKGDLCALPNEAVRHRLIR
jgi:predicted DCC family thiol-disulfide oxidoreductase YuxK